MSDETTPAPVGLADVISPAAAVEALARQGVTVSERTLREKARKMGAYRQIGRAIFFTAADIEHLIAPELTPPPQGLRQNRRQASVSASGLEEARSKLQALKAGRQRKGNGS